MRERWISLKFLPDPIQARAVEIVDELAESKLVSHRSSSLHVSAPRFDINILRPKNDQKTTDESHDQVAQYTRNMAQENKRLLEAQRGRKSGSNFSETSSQRISSPDSPQTPIASWTPSTVDGTPLQPIPLVPSIYLFGSVGRGKTVLMNLLFSCLSSSTRTTRFHFFELMKRIHIEMVSGCTIVEIANKLADETDVIFLDELAITDIQDATILPTLMSVLIRRNVAMVMTSNQHPQSLYMNGLNRHIYLPPFLNILKQSGCRLVSLDDKNSSVDYRNLGSVENRVWRWTTTTSSLPMAPPAQIKIPLSPTRSLDLVQTSAGFSTSATYLTNDQFSDSDYVKLADFVGPKLLQISVDSKFSASDILGPARRFGKLVEILYDKKINVEFVSSIQVNNLFESTNVQELIDEGYLGESLNSVASSLAASSVDEGLRSIERCLSRLSQASHR